LYNPTPPIFQPDFCNIHINLSVISNTLSNINPAMVNLEWNHFGPIPPAEADAKASAEKLYLDLRDAFPGYVADFERKFTAWKDKWHGGEMAFANK
jgi:hypothetical protein